jgi:hypothetical protein
MIIFSCYSTLCSQSWTYKPNTDDSDSLTWKIKPIEPYNWPLDVWCSDCLDICLHVSYMR